MAAQKHAATGTDLLEKEKWKKCQSIYRTFEVAEVVQHGLSDTKN